MEKYIKYKRFQENLEYDKIQEFFDGLIRDGWEIIHYDEKVTTLGYGIIITVVAGKKQQIP